MENKNHNLMEYGNFSYLKETIDLINRKFGSSPLEDKKPAPEEIVDGVSEEEELVTNS